MKEDFAWFYMKVGLKLFVSHRLISRVVPGTCHSALHILGSQ